MTLYSRGIQGAAKGRGAARRRSGEGVGGQQVQKREPVFLGLLRRRGPERVAGRGQVRREEYLEQHGRRDSYYSDDDKRNRRISGGHQRTG